MANINKNLETTMEITSEEESDVSPIKQVELTVSKTDDPSLPVYTFRMWFLGTVSCVLLSFTSQFFWYRTQPLSITVTPIQIAVLPIGHLMARLLPKRIFFQGTGFEFTLNPGPFNVKEHVLITMYASAGAGGVYATHVISAVKLYYKKPLGFLPALIVMMTTQLLGYGWAGVFRRHLVEPAEMWWPSNLVQVSLFRALHDKEKRPRGGITRMQFFIIVVACTFVYTVFPTFLFSTMATISWICWVAPKSVLTHQLGSGLKGLGIGAIGFDWSTITSYLQSPLASPWFATANIAVGYFLTMYVIIPIAYWSNLFNAKHFPILSNQLFKLDGSRYNTDAIIDSNFSLDKTAYNRNGRLYMSTFFALAYGLGFSTLTATIVHILLFNGRDILDQTKNAFKTNKRMDVHTRLMKKYKQVPMWWFLVILVGNIALILYTCQHYKSSLQLPWWGVLLACAISFFYTLPIGIIVATTNQQPGLNIITEYIIGYAYPGRPVANMCFKVYGYISMVQALTFVQDFKLGHYMKIPPRAMFNIQVVGTIVSVLVYTVTAWWLMGIIPNICDTSMLPENSPWTCPRDAVFYDASVIWGLVGPQRIFGNLGVYSAVNWYFLVGAVAPVLVWLAAKAYPEKKWIRLINMPILLASTAGMPPAGAINYNSWIIVAFIFGFVVFRYCPKWWQKYNYVLSGGLEAGTAFFSVLIFFVLNSVSVDWWGTRGEGCPLASCPTAKGISVEGCPVY